MILTDDKTTEQLDKYKYGVQLGTAIWAAAAVSLAPYISSDHFKNHDQEANKNPPVSKAP